MNGLLWVLLVGVTGWLTGKIIGGRGYGESLTGTGIDWLDFVLGIMGGSFAGYLLTVAAIGGGSSFTRYATAALGSITLVWVARLISMKYMPSSVRKG